MVLDPVPEILQPEQNLIAEALPEDLFKSEELSLLESIE